MLSDWYGLNCIQPYSYVEALPLVPQNVTIFGYKVFKDVIKLKSSHHMGGPQYNLTVVPIKKWILGHTKRHQGCTKRGKIM